LKSPRLLATHLPINCIPKQLKQTKCKVWRKIEQILIYSFYCFKFL
jgi:hypothetical protein